jgi:hypothetical protein
VRTGRTPSPAAVVSKDLSRSVPARSPTHTQRIGTRPAPAGSPWRVPVAVATRRGAFRRRASRPCAVGRVPPRRPLRAAWDGVGPGPVGVAGRERPAAARTGSPREGVGGPGPAAWGGGSRTGRPRGSQRPKRPPTRNGGRGTSGA